MKRNDILAIAFIIAAFLVSMMGKCCNANAQQYTLQKPFGTIVYDDALKCPIMVSYLLTTPNRSSKLRREKWAFKADTALPKPRATSSDYVNSGYQRGHMCPAADMASSKTLMKSTFVMSNVAPQSPTLNMGQWKRIEARHRQYVAVHGACSVRVGSLFLLDSKSRIGRHSLAVPSHFIRIIWQAGSSLPPLISIVENK